MKRLLVILMAGVFAFALVGCGDAGGYESDSQPVDPPVSSDDNSINLNVVPDGATLVAQDQFLDGCRMIRGKSTEVGVKPTIEDVEKAFGTPGVYFSKLDEDDGVYKYKSYAWYSEEDWMDGKVAVGVTFRQNPDTYAWEVYSYVSSGINMMEVE